MSDATTLQLLGAGGFGALIGWYIYYINRYRKDAVQLGDLVTLIGAIGGGAVLTLFPEQTDLFGAYGVGLFAGFFGYFLLLVVLVLRSSGEFAGDLVPGRSAQAGGRPGRGRGLRPRDASRRRRSGVSGWPPPQAFRAIPTVSRGPWQRRASGTNSRPIAIRRGMWSTCCRRRPQSRCVWSSSSGLSAPVACSGGCCAVAGCRRARTCGVRATRACPRSRWATTARATSSWRGPPSSTVSGTPSHRCGCASAPCGMPPPPATRANVLAGAAGRPSSSGRRRWSVTCARSSRPAAITSRTGSWHRRHPAIPAIPAIPANGRSLVMRLRGHRRLRRPHCSLRPRRCPRWPHRSLRPRRCPRWPHHRVRIDHRLRLRPSRHRRRRLLLSRPWSRPASPRSTALRPGRWARAHRSSRTRNTRSGSRSGPGARRRSRRIHARSRR